VLPTIEKVSFINQFVMNLKLLYNKTVGYNKTLITNWFIKLTFSIVGGTKVLSVLL